MQYVTQIQRNQTKKTNLCLNNRMRHLYLPCLGYPRRDQIPNFPAQSFPEFLCNLDRMSIHLWDNTAFAQRGQHRQQRPQNPLRLRSTRIILGQPVAEEVVGVRGEVGDDQHPDGFRASHGMEPDDGPVVGAKGLGGIEEGFETGAGETRFERVRRVGVFFGDRA